MFRWGEKKKRREKTPGHEDDSDGSVSDATTTETIVEDAQGNKIRVIRKGSKVVKKVSDRNFES